MFGECIVLINNETENKQQTNKKIANQKAENSHYPKTVYLTIYFLACLHKT